MTKRVCIILLCQAMNFFCWSQSKPKVYLGLDLFRSLPTYFNSGYTLEPSIIYKINDKYGFDFSFGTTNISRTHIYNNIDYKSKGTYFKLGARKV
ncbi:MAG: hypothetical protein ORN54_01045, partial [Cyclobacteriaceae bacterium]|nr:hypothetical protein [Cyclobacteriaceae bacterium]